MKKQINNLTEKLQNIFGQRLISIILHGASAIDGIQTENQKNILSYFMFKQHIPLAVSLIIIIDKLDAADLKSASSPISEWKRTGHPLPIFMDREEWFNSTDIYPMEYCDIKRRHKILYGENLINELIISKANLRLQCEYELKNLLIKLRETYLGNIHYTKFLNLAIISSSRKLISLFRSVLEITEETLPHSPKEVTELLGNKVNIDKELFNIIFSAPKAQIKFSKNQIEEIIPKLIDSLNLLLKYVDTLNVDE
ncbi:MAG: hypothetical protein WCK67_12520 [bacterium]